MWPSESNTSTQREKDALSDRLHSPIITYRARPVKKNRQICGQTVRAYVFLTGGVLVPIGATRFIQPDRPRPGVYLRSNPIRLTTKLNAAKTTMSSSYSDNVFTRVPHSPEVLYSGGKQNAIGGDDHMNSTGGGGAAPEEIKLKTTNQTATGGAVPQQ